MTTSATRPLTQTEYEVLDKLLSVPFPGRDQLHAQLPHTMVVEQCGCGCATVSLHVDGAVAVPAQVTSDAPVSADISVDEHYAGIVLLVAGGYLSQLEIYSIGEPVRTWPPVENIWPHPA